MAASLAGACSAPRWLANGYFAGSGTGEGAADADHSVGLNAFLRCSLSMCAFSVSAPAMHVDLLLRHYVVKRTVELHKCMLRSAGKCNMQVFCAEALCCGRSKRGNRRLSAAALVVTECSHLVDTRDVKITGKGNMRADRPTQEHQGLLPPAQSR